MAKSVVLIHGLWLHGWVMRWLSRQLRLQGFDCHIFSYPSVSHDLEQNAKFLSHFLNQFVHAPHLVCHSLGGVLVRALCHYYPRQEIGRIVMLGSPIQGSAVATAMNQSYWGRKLIGRSIQVFLQTRLNWTLLQHQVGMIAGIRRAGIGCFLPGSPPIGDGTVAISETQAPGLTDHITVFHSHTGMLFSPLVAKQAAAFLKQGHFKKTN